MSSSIRVTSVDGTAREVVLDNGQRLEIQPGDRVEVLHGASVAQANLVNQDMILVFANGERVSLGGFGEALQVSSATSLVLPEPGSLSVRLTDAAGQVSHVEVSANARLDVADGDRAEVLEGSLPRYAAIEGQDLIFINQAGDTFTLGNVAEQGALKVGAIAFPHVIETAAHGADLAMAAPADTLSALSPVASVDLLRTTDWASTVSMPMVTAAAIEASLPVALVVPTPAAPVEAAPMTRGYQILSTVAAPILHGISNDTGRSSSDENTQASNVTLTGSTGLTTYVQIWVDDVPMGTKYPDSNGDWSIDLVLAPGAHVVTAKAFDGPDQSDFASMTVTRDIQAPDAPLAIDLAPDSDSGTPGDETTNAPTPEFVGQAEADSLVTVTNGMVTATVMADGTGLWTVAAGTFTTDGTHTVSVTATDAAGNTGSATIFDFELDTAEPGAPNVNSFSVDSGSSATDRITQETAPTLSGTAEADSLVTIMENGETLGTVMADAMGNWTITTATLENGAHTVTVTATDHVDNVSAETIVNFTVDTQAPTAPAAIALSAASDSGTQLDNKTNDTTPELTGTAEANSAIALTVDNGAVLTATTDANGLWTVTGATVSGESLHTVSVTATDAAGNTSSAGSYSFTLDTQAPGIPTVTALSEDTGANATDKLTSDKTPTLSGTAEANSTVVLTDNGVIIATATADGSGAWSATSTIELTAQGLHTVTVTATDAAGNTGSAGTYNFSLDSAAPGVPTAITLTADADTGISTSDKLTKSTTPTFTGTAEANSQVTLSDSGVIVATATADAGGMWTANIATPLAVEGAHTVTVTSTDAAGNTSSANTHFTLDIQAPGTPSAIGLTFNTDLGTSRTDDITSSTTPVLEGSADANSQIVVTIGATTLGTVTANTEGAWTVSLGAPGEGVHTVSVVAIDAAGNTSTASAPQIIEIDNVAPLAPTSTRLDATSDTGLSDSDKITQTRNPVLLGSAEAHSRVFVKVDNLAEVFTGTVSASGNWTVTTLPELADGLHTASVSVIDRGGNQSPGSVISFTVDNSAPSVPTVTGFGTDTGANTTDKLTYDATPTFNGQAEANSQVTLTDNGVIVATVSADVSGLWTATTSELTTQSAHTITVTSTDAAGNTSSVDTHFSLDTQAPTAPAAIALSTASDSGVQLDNKTNDTTPEFTGTAEANSAIALTVDGGAVLTATADANGLWTVTGATVSGESLHTVSVTTTDAAGNTSSAGSYSFTLDTTVPTVTVDSTISDDTGTPGDKITKDTTPTFSGTTDADSQVTLTDNGVVIATATADGAGLWTATSSVELTAQGLHTITVTSTDTAGNTSSVNTSFSLDTVVPGVTVNGAIGTDTGASSTDKITFDTTPEFTGTAEANSQVTLTDNSVIVATVTADVSGLWTVATDALSAQGAHTVTVTATDGAGNTNSVDTHFTLDTQAPTAPAAIALATGSDSGTKGDNKTNDTTPELTGTAEANSQVVVSVDGTATYTTTANVDGLWSVTASASISDGAHVVTAVSTDAAGNVSDPSNIFIFGIDTLAPAVPTVNALSDDTGASTTDKLTNDTTPALSGTAEANSVVTLTDNNVVIATALADGAGLWTATVATPLTAQGLHTVTVTATDDADNTSTAGTYNFSLDTVAPNMPTVTGFSDDSGTPNDKKSKDTTPEFRGTAEANSVVVLTDNGTFLGSVTADSTGLWTVTSAELTAQGLHTISVASTDAAGNTSTGTTQFTLDTVAPTTPSLGAVRDAGGLVENGMTNSDFPVFTGTADAGSQVTISEGVDSLGSTVANNAGLWTVTASSPFAEGLHTVTISATDAAGNISAGAATSLTVDMTAPSVTVASTISDDTGASTTDGLTNDKTPTFTGTAEAGSQVTLNDNGTIVATVTADGAGLWTATTTELTAQGLHTITVTATDAAGNTGSVSTGFTLDSVMATVTVSSFGDDTGVSTTDKITSDTTPTFNGTAEANSIVTLTDNGTFLGSATADSNGLWTVTSTALADQGAHTITVTAADAAGNTSSVNTGLTLDSVAPSVTVASTISGDTGASTTDGLTSDKTPTFNGTAEAGSQVTLTDNGVVIATVTADGAGLWTATSNVELTAQGLHTITVTAADTAGNTSSVNTGFTLDTVVPGVTVNGAIGDDTGASTTDKITSDTTPTFTGTAEANSQVTLTDNGTVVATVTADGGGLWTATTTELTAQGLHTITVTATDAAGNTGSVSTGFSLDSVVPTVTIASFGDDTGTPGDKITKDTTPTFGGTAEANSVVVLTDNGTIVATVNASSSGLWTATTDALTTQGAHAVTVTATDAAGNVGSAGSYNFTLDTLAPTVTVASVISDDTGASTTDKLTSETTPTFTGTAEVGSQVTLSDNGTIVATVTADGGGLWTATTTELTAQGLHTVTVTATDGAGNTSSVDTGFSLDTQAPTTPTAIALSAESDSGTQLDNKTSNTTPELTGMAEANSAIALTVDGATLLTTTADANGLWTVTGAMVSGEGLHTVSVTATDAAGNTGSAGSYNFTLDTTAPDAPTATTASLTNDTTPSLSGTAEAGSLVTLTEGATVLGTVTADGAGLWTVSSSALLDGLHTVTVSATDAADNSSEVTTVNLTLDTDAPGAPTAIALSTASDSGVQLDSKTNDTTPELTGTAEANSAIALTVDGGAVLTATADANGLWTVTGATVSGEGLHTVSVTATDAAGNTGSAGSFEFTLDTTAPTVGTVSLALTDRGADADTTSVVRPTFDGSVEAGSTVAVTVGSANVPVVQDGMAWTASVGASLTEGLHTVSVTATDAAGNTTTTETAFNVVTTPQAPTTAAPAINEETGSLQVTSTANQVFMIVGDTTITGTGTANTWSFDTDGVTEGDHTVYSVEVDAAGNLILGAPTTVSFPGATSTYQVLAELGDDLGGHGLAGLTLDYSSLTTHQAAQPASADLAVSAHDVLDFGTDAAAIDLGALAQTDVASADGAAAEAGRQTAEGIFTPPDQDFGFGADAMITGNNPYLHLLENAGWQQI
jgi:hypothetical protein